MTSQKSNAGQKNNSPISTASPTKTTLSTSASSVYVVISAPADKAEFPVGEKFTLWASAIDPDTGADISNSVQWTANSMTLGTFSKTALPIVLAPRVWKLTASIRNGLYETSVFVTVTPQVTSLASVRLVNQFKAGAYHLKYLTSQAIGSPLVTPNYNLGPDNLFTLTPKTSELNTSATWTLYNANRRGYLSLSAATVALVSSPSSAANLFFEYVTMVTSRALSTPLQIGDIIHIGFAGTSPMLYLSGQRDGDNVNVKAVVYDATVAATFQWRVELG